MPRSLPPSVPCRSTTAMWSSGRPAQTSRARAVPSTASTMQPSWVSMRFTVSRSAGLSTTTRTRGGTFPKAVGWSEWVAIPLQLAPFERGRSVTPRGDKPVELAAHLRPPRFPRDPAEGREALVDHPERRRLAGEPIRSLARLYQEPLDLAGSILGAQLGESDLCERSDHRE